MDITFCGYRKIYYNIYKIIERYTEIHMHKILTKLI